MSTLFVYSSNDEAINSLCRESAFKKSKTQTLQLTPYSHKSALSRFLGINRHHSRFSVYDVDFELFDRIIIACDELAGFISPEVEEFISTNNFRYKNVDCIVFGEGRFVKKAQDSLKVKLSLSGGTVRNCVTVSAKEIKREEEDLLFSVRHRLAV